MEILTGWKPMPVLLKIVWILTMVGTVLSVFVLSAVYGNGTEFFGYKVYGMSAVNVEFFLSLAIPVVLLVAMMRRYRWAWPLGAGLFLLHAVNTLFGFVGFDEKVAEVMAMMEEMPQFAGQEEAMPGPLFFGAIFGSILVFSGLVNLAFMIFFIIKRKYFAPVIHVEGPAED